MSSSVSLSGKLMLTEATEFNLKRKAAYADHLQLVNGLPLFSWLDRSITEMCNRSAGSQKACSFCPRIDPSVYPNQKLHMSLHLARKIAAELKEINYEGAVILCGFGEPLLHPFLEIIVSYFKGLRLEIVTNGDRLTSKKIEDLYLAGANYIVVSMYDGPHQVEHFRKMFDDAGVTGEKQYGYVLRDRWHDAAHDFGLQLTNRAGTIDAGYQAPVDQNNLCYYPSYALAVDWNGDVLLCVQDWNKRARFGNLYDTSLVEAWQSTALHKRRIQLAKTGRMSEPCSSCNAQGTCHGLGHATVWLEPRSGRGVRAE